MNVFLESLRQLSDSLASLSDDRPAWLKEMPYGMEHPSHYYRLVWEIAKRYQPKYTVEIGIDKGGSTLSLAAGYPGGSVDSIDIDGPSCRNAEAIASSQGLKNLNVIQGDSLTFNKRPDTKIDLLFIDGAHDFMHCYREYSEFRPFMKDGGIILFDDIHESREMDVAWSFVVDPKIELPKAHHSGFGVCKVNQSLSCPTFDSIKDEAKRKYS